MSVAVRGSAAALVLAAFASVASLLRVSAQRLVPAPVETEIDVPPVPGDVARALTFGFSSLLADTTLLEAIQVLPMRHGDMPPETAGPLDRRLTRLLEYSVEVDPKFVGAYQFAAAALPHETMDGSAYGVFSAVRILEKGLRERPDDWHMGFLLGFLQSYYARDYAAAAKSMAIAAKQPGAPAYVGFLATRLAAQGGELQIATALAEAMLSQATEEETRNQWRARVQALRMESDLRNLEDAVQRYREQRGAVPRSVQTLVASGYLAAAPAEPHGGRYLIGRDGSVRSTVAERLRVYGADEKRELH